MAIHKLFIDDLEEADFQLIAIHSHLENFRIAYFVNQQLQTRLSKSQKGVLIQKTAFSAFLFEDEKNDMVWTLIENKKEVQFSSNSAGLFANDGGLTSHAFFLPELKKVDYFLKIEGEEKQINTIKIIHQLKKINQISTVYAIQYDKLKSKNNLIF